MPWFQSSKDKEFRLLIEGKMEICLNKPDKYEQAFPVLDSLVRKPNQKAIEMIVDHIKQVIKDEDLPPLQKVQAMKLLRDLMQSQSKPLGKYVVKKILKRLTIFAQHRKNQKNQQRGSNIFKCKKSEQKYGIQFLKIILQCLSDWGQNWPRNADGPFHDFHSAFNDLLMQKQVSFPKDVKKANKSPFPKVGFRNSRPEQAPQQRKIQTSVSKPVVIKQKKVLKKPQAQYINQMIEMLGLLSQTLKQNEKFDDTWTIIKAYGESFKGIDQKGNFIVCELIESGQRNEQLQKIIQNNSNFIAGLNKNINIVDKKNQIYLKFNKQYVTICNNLIISLSKFNQKSSLNSINNNNNRSTLKPQNQTSINQKIEQKPKQRPLAHAGDNRYGSSNQLRNQLELNFKIRKQDFNSGTLSRNNENSQRGIQGTNPNRNSMNYNNSKQFHKQKQINAFNQQRRSINEVEKVERVERVQKVEKKSLEQQKIEENKKIGEQNQKKLKQISKITQKNQNQSENNFSQFQISKQESSKQKQKQKQKFDGSFRDFQIQNPKPQKQDSNSDFFKQLQQKKDPKLPTKLRRNQKIQNKQKQKQKQLNDFFGNDVKSKDQSDNKFSGFQKSNQQTNSKIKQIVRNSNQLFSNSKGFDTFKSPNQISKVIQQIRQSKKSHQSQISNPLDQKRSFGDKNFFAQNSFNRQIQKGNQFLTNQINNPFADDGNPFKTQIKNNSKISRQWNDSQSKSNKSNNPFSQKDSSKGSKRAGRPPIDRQKTQKSQVGNPFGFETISQPSRREVKTVNQFQTQKSQNPFGNSFISNKSFEKKQNKLDILNQKSNQLSQRGSFKDPRSLQVASVKNQSQIKNPFQILPGLGQNSKINYDQQNHKQCIKSKKSNQQKKIQFSGFNFDDFMDKSSSKSVRQSQIVKTQQKQDQQKSKFSGFGFDAFNNVKNQKNNSQISKQFIEEIKNIQKNHQISKQSFDFFKLENIKQSIPQKDDFFTSKQFHKNKINKYNNQSQFIQKNSIQSKNQKQIHEFGFDDFKNIQKSSLNQKSSFQNPFTSEQNTSQQNKSSIPQYGFDDFKNINEQSSLGKNPFSMDSKSKQQPSNQNAEYPQPEIRVKSNESEDLWQKFGKNNLNESDQWRKFGEYKQKSIKNNEELFNQVKSEYQPSFDKQQLKDQADIQPYPPIQSYSKRQSPHFQKQPYFGQQKSISLEFQDTSPFQKKYIAWNYTGIDQSSSRYNITDQNIRQKKQIVIKLQQKNMIQLQKYRKINDRVNQLKKNFAGYLNKLGQIRQQKRQFKIILKRLEQTNQIKQKQIQELIKKKKRAEEIKIKILEKQRLLYQRIKSERKFKESSVNNKQRVVNKWDRFNKNLQRQRDLLQQQKTVSHFSYYA